MTFQYVQYTRRPAGGQDRNESGAQRARGRFVTSKYTAVQCIPLSTTGGLHKYGNYLVIILYWKSAINRWAKFIRGAVVSQEGHLHCLVCIQVVDRCHSMSGSLTGNSHVLSVMLSCYSLWSSEQYPTIFVRFFVVV